jgi:DNA polymerase
MLVNGMFKAENNGYPIVMHVHDECVSMLPDNVGSLGDFMDQLTTPPTWALDFPLTAEGYEATSYRK